jgi:hypothetical protein
MKLKKPSGEKMQLFGSVLAASTVCVCTLASAKTIHVTNDRGGLIVAYEARYRAAAARGDRFVIDGNCLSACTMAIGIFDNKHICATPRAVLGFHSAWRPTPRGKIPASAATDYMARWYTPAAKDWIERNGGLGPSLMYLRGSELYAVVPACESGKAEPHQVSAGIPSRSAVGSGRAAER